MKLGDKFDKDAVKEVFGKYISADSPAEIWDRGDDVSKMRKCDFIYMLIGVKEDTFESIPGIIEAVTYHLVSNKWIIDSIISSLIVAVRHNAKPTDIIHDNDIYAILSNSPKSIRIVYGFASGMCGNFGANNAFIYGYLIPDFSRILSFLLNMGFGEYKLYPK